MNIDNFQPVLITLIITSGICFITYVLKNQLGIFITKLSIFKLKKKDGDNETTLELATDITTSKTDNLLTGINQNIDKVTDVPCLPESTQDKPTLNRYDQFCALKNEGKEAGEKIYKELLQKSETDEQIFQTKLHFIEDCFYTGYATIEDYYTLITNNIHDTNKINQIHYSLGINLKINHRYLDSIEYMMKIIPNEPDENLLTASIIELSNLYKEINNQSESVNILRNHLHVIKQKNNLAKVYFQIASCIKNGNKELANVFYCQAGYLNPDDYDQLFNVAYNTDNNLLANYFYRILVSSEPNNYMALNNLGASYENMKFPINSIKNYKLAFQNGVTLSASNMARRLLDVGFVEEAKELLEEAKQKESIHKNVYNCFYDIENRTSDEATKLSQLEKNASQLIVFFSRNIDFFTLDSQPNDGEYGDRLGNMKIVIKTSDNKTKLTLTLNSYIYNSELTKKGIVLTFTRQSETYIYNSDKKMYFACNDTKVELIDINDENAYIEYILHRIEQ